MELSKPGVMLEIALDHQGEGWFPAELQAELDALITEIRSFGDDPNSLPPKFRSLYDAMPS